MKNIGELINEFVFCTKSIMGLDGIKGLENTQKDDFMEIMELAIKGDLGKGNHYNDEIRMAVYLENICEMIEEKEIRGMILAHANFLLVDGLVKYILFCVRQNGFLDKELALPLHKKVRELNEYVRTYGAMEVFSECIDTYLTIGHFLLGMVGMQ